MQGHGTALDPPGAWPKPPARHRVAANLEIRYFLRSNRAGTIFAMRQRSIIFALMLIAFSGCDPIVNIAGANFPAWLLCAIGGASTCRGTRCSPLLASASPP